MQFCVEEALLVVHDLDARERVEQQRRREAVAAAEERARVTMDRLQGRLH